MPLDLGELVPHRLELLLPNRARRCRRPGQGRDTATAEIVEPLAQQREVGSLGVARRVHDRFIGRRGTKLEARLADLA